MKRRNLTAITIVVAIIGSLLISTSSSANTVPVGKLFAQLQPPNTVFSVDASDPDGDPLTYEWSAQIECGVFTPNSPTDDQANWSHPSGEPPSGCPHEQGSDHAGVVSVIVRDPNGGAIQCRHDGSGDGEHDCNIYGEELGDCIIDMRLFDGQFGSLPLDEDEVTRGAVTVANHNDTDSKEGMDKDQNPVGGEKDLMKLRLFPPDPNEGGTVTLEVTAGSQYVKIFKRASKGDRLIPDPTLVFPAAALPKTLWVEGVRTSPLRGVGFHYSYTPPGATECFDDSLATIMWVTLVDALHDSEDPPWPQMSDPPLSAVMNHCGGFGLRPRGPHPRGVRNCIGFMFRVDPLGVQDLPGVSLDVTRQKRTHFESFLIGTNKVDEAPPDTSWPAGETANDDGHDNDESVSPDAEGLMFSFDGPGSPVPIIEGSRVRVFWELVFREFVRVRFDGEKPTGNRLAGSRASNLVRWQALHTWATSRDDTIHRSTGDERESDENLVRLL